MARRPPIVRAYLGDEDDADNVAGVFRGWTREQMRSWLDAQIAWTRKRLPALGDDQ